MWPAWNPQVLVSSNLIWLLIFANSFGRLDALAKPLHDCFEKSSPGFRADQSVFAQYGLDEPVGILASDKPISEDNLTRIVSDTYLKNLPSSIASRRELSGLSTRVIRAWKDLGKGTDYAWVDVLFPLTDTCRPVITKKIPLAEGLLCSEAQTCTQSTTITTTQSYESQFGLSISSTIGIEANEIFAKETFSVTLGASFSYTWGTQNQFSKSYTFNIGPGQFCVPSMIHLELECDMMGYTVHWDSYVDTATNFTNMIAPMMPDIARKDPIGPYMLGAWCSMFMLDEETYFDESLWTPVRTDNPKLGAFNRGRPTDLTSHVVYEMFPGLTDDLIIIRVLVPSDYPTSYMAYKCMKQPTAGKRKTARIPVSESNNALMGYVGCVN